MAKYGKHQKGSVSRAQKILQDFSESPMLILDPNVKIPLRVAPSRKEIPDSECYRLIDDKNNVFAYAKATPASKRRVSQIYKKKRLAEFNYALVYIRDGFRCQYTGDELTPKVNTSIDHIQKLADGGEKSAYDNVVCCEKSVNSNRDILDVELIRSPWRLRYFEDSLLCVPLQWRSRWSKWLVEHWSHLLVPNHEILPQNT